MATDYDATRKTDDDTESLDALKDRIPTKPSAGDDDVDNADGFSIPDVVNEELEVVVVPIQENEFTCVNCFLVKPRAQLAAKPRSGPVCIECAS
ncbi:MAG: DUF4193 family protein [Aquiluna sp.]|nr:DUF4193 family protein [Aquiluna sp.]